MPKCMIGDCAPHTVYMANVSSGSLYEATECSFLASSLPNIASIEIFLATREHKASYTHTHTTTVVKIHRMYSRMCAF